MWSSIISLKGSRSNFLPASKSSTLQTVCMEEHYNSIWHHSIPSLVWQQVQKVLLASTSRTISLLSPKKKKKKKYFSTQPDPMLQANWSLQQNNYWWNKEDIGGRNGKLINTYEHTQKVHRETSFAMTYGMETVIYLGYGSESVTLHFILWGSKPRESICTTNQQY